jgi:hypothetical protein
MDSFRDPQEGVATIENTLKSKDYGVLLFDSG